MPFSINVRCADTASAPLLRNSYMVGVPLSDESYAVSQIISCKKQFRFDSGNCYCIGPTDPRLLHPACDIKLFTVKFCYSRGQKMKCNTKKMWLHPPWTWKKTTTRTKKKTATVQMKCVASSTSTILSTEQCILGASEMGRRQGTNSPCSPPPCLPLSPPSLLHLHLLEI